MHFYCFPTLFTSDFTDFSSHSAYSVVNSSSPIQELEPGATPYRGGRCAAAILADCKQPKNKNTLDYDVFPPMESNHRKGRAGRGMGEVYCLYTSIVSIASQSI